MPRSLLVSSQNEKARRFDHFYDIEVFQFNDMIFNIDCCCIFANYEVSKVGQEDVLDKYPIISHTLDSESLEVIEEVNLEPYAYFQKKRKEKYRVKKLIDPEKINELLPFALSHYYKEFIQGADLIPKALLYCVVANTIQQGKISIIDPWISPQAKGV